jgi:hypothetical protein
MSSSGRQVTRRSFIALTGAASVAPSLPQAAPPGREVPVGIETCSVEDDEKTNDRSHGFDVLSASHQKLRKRGMKAGFHDHGTERTPMLEGGNRPSTSSRRTRRRTSASSSTRRRVSLPVPALWPSSRPTLVASTRTI